MSPSPAAATLAESVREHVAACFSGLFIRTHEPAEAVAELRTLCVAEGWALATWDAVDGVAGEGLAFHGELDLIAALKGLIAAGGPTSEPTLLVLHNVHRYLDGDRADAALIQCLQNTIVQGKTQRCYVVLMGPVVAVPPELAKLVVVLEHELPGPAALEQIARTTAEGDELPSGEGLARLVAAAGGLTRYEAEGAFALSLIRHDALDPEVVWGLKANAVRKTGVLELHRGEGDFGGVGGLEFVKDRSKRAMRPGVPARARARGILMLGAPGTGKSLFAKALGNEVGRPTLLMDVGALMGSLVGQSEANLRAALAVADAMSPAILFIDEIEKALSGTASSGQTDGGTTARMFGTLLTWMNDHTSDVFVVATANDIRALPKELVRPGRFDNVYFVDLPDAGQREEIWQIQAAAFGLDPAQPRPDDGRWTGAEIAQCCRLAALYDVPLAEAGRDVIPVASTAGAQVEELRQWAAGRCLDAGRGGLFRPDAAAPSPAEPAGDAPARALIRRRPGAN